MLEHDNAEESFSNTTEGEQYKISHDKWNMISLFYEPRISFIWYVKYYTHNDQQLWAQSNLPKNYCSVRAKGVTDCSLVHIHFTSVVQHHLTTDNGAACSGQFVFTAIKAKILWFCHRRCKYVAPHKYVVNCHRIYSKAKQEFPSSNTSPRRLQESINEPVVVMAASPVVNIFATLIWLTSCLILHINGVKCFSSWLQYFFFFFF